MGSLLSARAGAYRRPPSSADGALPELHEILEGHQGPNLKCGAPYGLPLGLTVVLVPADAQPGSTRFFIPRQAGTGNGPGGRMVVMGSLELPTFRLSGECSTPELHDQFYCQLDFQPGCV